MKKHNQSLLVEGNDDFHVVCSLCAKHNVSETFDVIDSNGKENLLISLPVRLKGSSDLKTLGVVIDADTSIDATWRAIKEILEKCGQYSNIPDNLPSGGLILNPDRSSYPVFGLWIMPDNVSSGMLETFMHKMIPDEDLLIDIVDEVLYGIEQKGLARYKAVHKDKARIHTWLAWQEDPGTPMGLAIKKEFFIANKTLANAFVDWLNNLFCE